jgi:hypothetical protein
MILEGVERRKSSVTMAERQETPPRAEPNPLGGLIHYRSAKECAALRLDTPEAPLLQRDDSHPFWPSRLRGSGPPGNFETVQDESGGSSCESGGL